MSGYTIAFEEARGVLALRVGPDFKDSDVELLHKELASAVAVARQRGPLRFLCDNRVSKAFPDGTHQKLWDALSRNGTPADRIAVLVANSLAKAQSREKTGDRGASFASENAAYIWLSVGSSAAA